MIKLFILIIIISISGCVNKNIKQRMMYKNPGLVALHDLIVGEKTRKEVLIFGCTNHPADYSDKELCKCVNSSKAHLIEKNKRNLSCGYNNKEYKRSTFKPNDSKTKDRFMKESTKSLENYYTRNRETKVDKLYEKIIGLSSKLPKCPKMVGKYGCYGTQKFKQFTYVGEFKNRKRHGKGFMTWMSGDKYVGEFVYGQREGKGTYTWKNGDNYVGTYKNNKMHGTGKLTWAKGDIYEGDFFKDKRTGLGKYVWTSGDKYIGKFKNGRLHGKGKFLYKNGNIKEGVWSDDVYKYATKTNKPKNISKNSSLSTSQNKNTKFNQLPKCRSGYKDMCFGEIITKKYKYIGEFKKNMMHGKGKYTHIGDDKFKGYTYVGQYFKDKRHGYGKAGWPNGQKFSGEYLNGEPNGFGVYTYFNGDIYQGILKNGIREGEGKYVYKSGKLEEGLWKNNKFLYAKKINKTQKKIANMMSNISSDDVYASRQELERERQKRIELERKLAILLDKQKNEEKIINADIRAPILEIVANKTIGKRGTIRGIAKDNVEVAEVTVDGKTVSLSSNGNFNFSTYVPPKGKELKVEVTDIAGLTTSKIIKLKANRMISDSSISFESLNPLNKRVKKNEDALALIVGVSNYENTKAKALYADNDAMVFKDYATEKLGISKNRIKILLNDGADERDILLSVQEWLRRSAKPNKSDIYVFFAGHGLASQDGKNMYLLPHDGSPRLLEKTAILRDELFSDIKEANPKSVTVFLDTCYSGETRNEEILVAGRPVAIIAKEQAIPDGFTLFSAASNEQISRPLEEAKHGMFSYFLMKGMEGDADTNADNKITARELHIYVKQNVVQQSSGSQTPELQGDKDRVIVNFN